MDTVDVEIVHAPKKNGLAAGAEIMAFNGGIWAFARYMREVPWSYIDIQSMKNNIRQGFAWDFDEMEVNMIAHPYHGGLYFNSARSNGFNFWQSGLFAAAGSAMWEWFMEHEYPSTSDILVTPIGGVAVGESFFRLSDRFLDNRLTGSSRFAHELLGCLFSPARTFDRLVSGKAWKTQSTSGRQFGNPECHFDVATGLRFIHFYDLSQNKTAVNVSLSVEYGDRFNDENPLPYDYFQLDLEASNTISTVVSRVNLVGRYACTALVDNEKSFLNLGIYQHIDFYNTNPISGIAPYRFGGPATGGIGLYYQNKPSKDIQLDAFAHVNGVLLAAIYTEYFRESARDYNNASGFSCKTGVNLTLWDKIRFSTAYEGYRLFTWQGYPKDVNRELIWSKLVDVQGDKSQATFQVLDCKASVDLGSQFYLAGGYRNFTRHTDYADYPSVFSRTAEKTFLLGYRF